MVSAGGEDYRIDVDASKVNELLKELNDDEALKGFRSALRKSILLIRQRAQENLLQVATDAEFGGGSKGQYFKPLKNEIRLVVYKNASGALVSIMDTGQKGSRSFLLRFFEGGTKERMAYSKKRYRHKPAYRGKLNASLFFKNAVEAKKSGAEAVLSQNIMDTLKKIAEKKR